jgi:hypothetical protein
MRSTGHRFQSRGHQVAATPLKIKFKEPSPFGVTGMGFNLNGQSGQTNTSHNKVIFRNGKLVHRVLIDEYRLQEKDITEITKDQIILIKDSSARQVIHQQLAELPKEAEMSPNWHLLEKLLRSTPNSTVYLNLVAITDIGTNITHSHKIKEPQISPR